MKDRGISEEEREYNSLLQRAINKAVYVFTTILDLGLDEVKVSQIEFSMLESFKNLRNGIAPEKIGADKNFSKFVKEKIILPQIDRFVKVFENAQLNKKNGELYDIYEKLAIEMVDSILKQTDRLIK